MLPGECRILETELRMKKKLRGMKVRKATVLIFLYGGVGGW
jgi:hypothetical protein